MNFLKIGLAVLVGFALAVVPFRVPQAKAQQAGNVLVLIHPVMVLDKKSPIDKIVPGSRVNGISCIPTLAKLLPDAAVCYVATTN